MNLIYEIHSSNYKPISFKGRYFYDYFEIIQSFLKAKINDAENSRLLKPILKGDGNIHWYGNFEGKFSRITELTPKDSLKVRTDLNAFLKKMQELGRTLKLKKDQENQDWGNLILNLFQHELVIVVANKQQDWALLWGWDFLSNLENKLPILPQETKPISVTSANEGSVDPTYSEAQTNIISNTHSSTRVETKPVESVSPESPQQKIRQEDQLYYTPVIPREARQRMGCLGRIRHWLRWISYRFWAFFWMLLYTLFVIWLCRYCNQPNCDAYCEKLKKTKKELIDLERRVRERCDSTYVKSN